MRLDRFLAHAGFGSRKEVKLLLKEKRIKVNNTLVNSPSININEQLDQISVDDNVINYQEFYYFILFKPKGYLSATDDIKYPTVMDLIHEPYRNLSPVGRLDLDTTGLLLITNNGKLNHFLLAPNSHVEKEYIVTVDKKLSSSLIENFKNGVILDDGYVCKEAILTLINDYQASLIIHEGKYHQVKRMFQAFGYTVMDLHRARMDFLTLDNLNVGEYRSLNKEEIIKILKHIKN